MELDDYDLRKDERLRQTRKLVGFAMKWAPQDMYEFAQEPAINHIAERVRRFIVDEYLREKNQIDSEAISILAMGVNDVAEVVEPALVAHPMLTKEQSLQLVGSIQTSQSIALSAHQTQEFSTYMYKNWHDYFVVTPDQTAIDTTREAYPGIYGGCPVVSYDINGIHSEPIFQNFTKWAGELAVISHFDHKKA